mgnify:CR=1 FL=1
MGFHTVGKEVGMNISKTRSDILKITGSMREAEDNAASMEEKLKMAVSHFDKENKKLDMISYASERSKTCQDAPCTTQESASNHPKGTTQRS